jgi:sensor c-di-GMP phosphodiesterase-like protein
MRLEALSRNHMMPLVLMLVARATMLPIGASILLAREQARIAQEQRALFYATDVLRRSEDTRKQITDAFSLLATTPDTPRCGHVRRQVLQRIDAVSSYIQFVGRMDRYHGRDRIVCASYGQFEVPLELGKPDLISANGFQVWLDLQFPFAADKRFIGIGNGKFIAVIHKSLPVDTTVAERDVSLAAIFLDGQRAMSTRGRFLPEWMPKPHDLAPGEQKTQLIGRNVVSQVRSRNYDLVAVAALNEEDFGRALASFARILIPLGIGTGLLLAYVVARVARGQMSLPAVIRSGLRNKEFFPVFQPVVRLKDRTWVGAEALIRWKRPGGQVIGPDLFIPAAEETNLICSITAEMLRQVEPTLAALAQRGDDMFVSINLSPQDLQEEGIETLLHDLLVRSGARPSQMHLEITERGLADTDENRSVIDRLRAKGLRVAVDDFGTGYSSLAELLRLNLDTIKIDKAFVDTIDSTAVTNRVAAHIVEMAHSLSLDMIAEGIERDVQAEILEGWRVQFGQGFLFARPMSSEAFLDGLARQDRAGHPSEDSGSPPAS